MKKLLLFAVIVPQIVVGADMDDDTDYPQKALDIAREQNQLLVSLAQNEEAVDIICRVKGRDLKQLIKRGNEDLDVMERQYKAGSILLNDLYNDTVAIAENVHFLIGLVADWSLTENLLALAANRSSRLFLLEENQELKQIIFNKLGKTPKAIAQEHFLDLSYLANDFENGARSKQNINDMTKLIIERVDWLINYAHSKSLRIHAHKGEKE